MLTNRKKLKNKINIKVKSLDKKNYSEILIDKNNDKYQEKMVDISNYGIKWFNY